MVADFAFLGCFFHLVFAAILHAGKAFVCAGMTRLNANVLGYLGLSGFDSERQSGYESTSQECDKKADHL
jgi:hypothetical protein